MTDILLLVLFLMTLHSSTCERQQASNKNNKQDILSYQAIEKDEGRNVILQKLSERLVFGRTNLRHRRIVLKYARKLRRLHRRQILDFDNIIIGGSGCTTFGCASDRASITTTTTPQPVAAATSATTSTESTSTSTSSSTESTSTGATTSTESTSTSTSTSTGATTPNTESTTTNTATPSTEATTASTSTSTESPTSTTKSNEATTTSTESTALSTELAFPSTEVTTSSTMTTAETHIKHHAVENRASPPRPPGLPQGPPSRSKLLKLLQRLS